jgi:hypothetical protein
MIATTVNALKHITPTEIKNAALKNITSAPFAQSVTRYIEPVEVNFEDIGDTTDGSIILCDSPSFEDTSGPEVDIANGIGIVKAIQGCKSVKPVVLIRFKSIGDRCDGLKNLAHVMVGLIPGIQEHMKSFSYIFTKFPSSEKSAIHALLKDFSSRMTSRDKSDASFTSIIKDMIKKTKGNPCVLDHIKDNRGGILDTLADSAFIHNPDEVFHFSITEKSKSVVREQLRQHPLNIISGTKRSDYPFVKYKLDQLKQLSDLLQHVEIALIYRESIKCVSDHLSEEYRTGTASLKASLEKHTTLTDADIQHYRTCIEHSSMAEPIRSQHLDTEVVHKDAFIQYVNQQMDDMFVVLKAKDINEAVVKVNLDNMKILSHYFPNIVDQYERVSAVR